MRGSPLTRSRGHGGGRLGEQIPPDEPLCAFCAGRAKALVVCWDSSWLLALLPQPCARRRQEGLNCLISRGASEESVPQHCSMSREHPRGKVNGVNSVALLRQGQTKEAGFKIGPSAKRGSRLTILRRNDRPRLESSHPRTCFPTRRERWRERVISVAVVLLFFFAAAPVLSTQS